jgi:hypothetical protein
MTVSNEIVSDDNESSYAKVGRVRSSSKQPKIWTSPSIILLKLSDIQSGDGSGNEGTAHGFWQSGLGS